MQGWFSPGQVFVLDEYCARNGVRGCHRHLCYLRDLLERAERGTIIDPTLLHYSFAFCASHVHGNRFAQIPFNMICTLLERIWWQVQKLHERNKEWFLIWVHKCLKKRSLFPTWNNFCLPFFDFSIFMFASFYVILNYHSLLWVSFFFIYLTVYFHIFSCVLPFVCFLFSLSFVAIVSYCPYYSSSHASVKVREGSDYWGRWAMRP